VEPLDSSPGSGENPTMSVEGWPNGTSGRISRGQWEGCWADVYSDDIGEGWHIEISGVPSDGGSGPVNWDSWFETRDDVLDCIRDMGFGSRASHR
jgi:hypothetical protein